MCSRNLTVVALDTETDCCVQIEPDARIEEWATGAAARGTIKAGAQK
jgi:hypothetical protein